MSTAVSSFPTGVLPCPQIHLSLPSSFLPSYCRVNLLDSTLCHVSLCRVTNMRIAAYSITRCSPTSCSCTGEAPDADAAAAGVGLAPDSAVLAKQGVWEAVLDEGSGSTYYYNTDTGESGGYVLCSSVLLIKTHLNSSSLLAKELVPSTQKFPPHMRTPVLNARCLLPSCVAGESTWVRPPEMDAPVLVEGKVGVHL